MTATHEISALDGMLMECLGRRAHFSVFDALGRLHCRICATTWERGEDWASDSGVCPGHITASEPVPVPGAQPVSLP